MTSRNTLIQGICGGILYHSPEENDMAWPDGARELRNVLLQTPALGGDVCVNLSPAHCLC